MSTSNPEISLPEKVTRLRLRVTAAAERQIRAGHPWVFADSVRAQNREGAPGELGVVFDRADKFLAVGFYDPDSPIRLRVLHAGKPTAIEAHFWHERLEPAVARRAGLFDADTTGYRVINGESDGWPGLVLDRYDTTLVLKIYTMAWTSRLAEIIPLIASRLAPERVVLRISRNVQAILEERTVPSPSPSLSQESASARPHVLRDGEVIHAAHGELAKDTPVVFLESGLRFEADVWRGQKTGFFLDQRENRRQVESLARGRSVLNAFSFSGGFSVYAARGGAKSVTDLDLSPHALESARRNFLLNWPMPSSMPCRRESIQADAFDWLSRSGPQKFDLLVLDPPSLARREVERAGAVRAYARLAESGLRQLAGGGILLACSCSAHVSAEEFFGAILGAARRSGRRFSERQRTHHAPDHPAGFPEAAYLKAIYLQF